jgi:hypothetical protein
VKPIARRTLTHTPSFGSVTASGEFCACDGRGASPVQSISKHIVAPLQFECQLKLYKAELKRAEVGYKELAERLTVHGLEETESGIASKMARGTFSATFLIAYLVA